MIRRLLIALPIAGVLWIAILALVLRLGASAPAVFVPFPPKDLISTLGNDIALTGLSPVSVTLRGDDPDLVARVYAAGAWIVLPAGLEACIPAFLRQDVNFPQ